MSGVVGLFRKSALLDVQLYAPEMATEDIDISWKLQRARYDVRYESNAIVWMQVPPTLGRLWKQRMRWARGLSQILRRHRGVWSGLGDRRLWPVVIEATLSVLWAYCAVLLRRCAWRNSRPECYSNASTIRRWCGTSRSRCSIPSSTGC